MGLICNFCGKVETPRNKVIETHQFNICNDCFNICKEDLEDKFDNTLEIDSSNDLLKPHEIKEKLDEYVIGQEEAKKILSVAVYNHYKQYL